MIWFYLNFRDNNWLNIFNVSFFNIFLLFEIDTLNNNWLITFWTLYFKFQCTYLGVILLFLKVLVFFVKIYLGLVKIISIIRFIYYREKIWFFQYFTAFKNCLIWSFTFYLVLLIFDIKCIKFNDFIFDRLIINGLRESILLFNIFIAQSHRVDLIILFQNITARLFVKFILYCLRLFILKISLLLKALQYWHLQRLV